MHANKCDVSAIDYKTKTVFAKKKFENSTVPTGNTKSGVVTTPSEEMKQYLREFSTYQ